MSEECADKSIEWVVKHFETLREEDHKLNDARFEAINEATNKAEQNMKDAKADLGVRLQGMNEFRDALRDQASKFVTVEVVNVRFELQAAKIESIERRWSWLVGAVTGIGLVLTALNIAASYILRS